MINNLTIIAGPCSVENHEQLHRTIAELCDIPSLDYIRCGVWKPRSRPDGFQGAGNEALKWIAELKKEFPKAKFQIEVASPYHVESALQFGIDAVWIGARTVSNPFSVQEVASALEGCTLPVMVKNPIAPDLPLWIGAIERLQKKNVLNIYAIHRGFTTPYKTVFRNMPLWNIALHLKKEMPDTPVLCDPSHISGWNVLVSSVAETAILLGFDGLMIESHCTPHKALSDSRQQLTPKSLNQLLDEIRNLDDTVLKNEASVKVTLKEHLNILHSEIDRINDEIAYIQSTIVEKKGIAENLEKSRQ